MKELIMRHFENTERQKIQEWENNKHIDGAISVYVIDGLPGDPLWIGDKKYALLNKFIAIDLDVHPVFKVEE